MKFPTGIILMGGQSTRMGTDKAHIKLNDQFLYQLAAEKLLQLCDKLFLSVNTDQGLKYKYEFPIIIDHHDQEGPIGGIISCFDSGISEMILFATDMINIDENDIENLLKIHKKDENVCSMYYNNKENYYEPMLSIWEENCLILLKKYFDGGGRSLQKFLKSQSIPIYNLINRHHFINVNYPNDLINQNLNY